MYDLAWSIAGAIPSNIEQLDLLLTGSWTSFKKLTWPVDIEKCCQDYFLVIPQPAFTCSKLTIETLEPSVKYVRR